MSDGKGKGRAKAGDDENPTSTADQSPQVSSSLLDRVVASATGLGRSAFTAPSGNEISEAAAGARVSSGKVQPTAGNSSSAWAESSNRTVQPGVSSQAVLPQLSSFRSGHENEHVQNAEAEFSSFLDGIDSFTPSITESDEIFSVDRAWENAVAQENVRRQGYTSIEEQQMHDGAAVMELLSDPSGATDTLELPQEQEDAVNWNLTEDQLMVLRGMLNELFPPGETPEAPRADHPLNLVPDLASLDGEEGRLQWMEQWDGVLNRYADEVWGELLPLVQEAREEVQSMKDDPPGAIGEQPKALRRLGLILGHLR